VRILGAGHSFSGKGDSLSQWRAYGGGTSGFAIGFSSAYLRSMAKELGWLVPVLYKEEEQQELICNLLEDVLREQRNRTVEERQGLAPSGNLIPYLLRYAPILKVKSFEEESEWRIVTHPRSYNDDLFAYRVGASMLVPYFRVSLGEAKSLGIEEIVIGPTPHPEQSIHSVRGLLTKNDIEFSARIPHFGDGGVVIKCSEVPYRSW